MRVKKLRTISLYDIGKTESYLSDMAKEGLQLIGIRQSSNIFKKREPADIEYRIEFGEKILNSEMREMYELAGWSYTCSIKGIHIFQAAALEDLVELHTDPGEQSYTLQKCCKAFARLISIETVLLLLIIAISFFATRIGNTPVLNQLENNFIYIISVAAVLYIIFEITKQLLTLIKIKKRLQMGFSIDHHEPWKKRPVSQFIMYCFVAVILIFSVATAVCNVRTIIGFITGKSHYAVTLDTELPIVRLNDIEKLQAPVIRTYFSGERKFLVSDVNVKDNLFIREMEVNEEFIQKDMTWQEDVYTPSLRTNYYKVYIPFMVQGALSDILYKAENYFIGPSNEKITAEKLDCKGLDEAYYISEDPEGANYFGLVVRKDNTILWMIYSGKMTCSEALEASQALFE